MRLKLLVSRVGVRSTCTGTVEAQAAVIKAREKSNIVVLRIFTGILIFYRLRYYTRKGAETQREKTANKEQLAHC